MNPARARRILVAVRAAVGWSSLLLPRLVLRAFGVPGEARDALVTPVRLVGTREALLSYQLYQAQRHGAPADELEEALRQNVLVGTLDTLTAVATGIRGGSCRRTVVTTVAASAGTALLALAGREGATASEDSP
jgi:hypothetical protein